MIFNSFTFIIFFILVFILYYLVNHKYRYIVLLIASYIFYGYSNYKYIILLLIVTILSFFSGKLVSVLKEKDKKKYIKHIKIIIGITILILLTFLIYFKYSEFIIININNIFKTNFSIEKIIVPLGISFFILQAISYPIDVYRGDIDEEKNFLRFALFISFFPQILSGPISKSKEMLPQFRKNHLFNFNNITNGLLIVFYGFFKKVVIADLLAFGINNVYNNLNNYTGISLIIVVFLYSIQIYLDFSSYSNIAYGCSKMLGFKLNKNFNLPYFAKNIKDFWSRWHISLSTWFRDYLYFPLGGSRKGELRTYLNITIVFLVSALWHGPAWTYVFWGFLHALYQIIERKFKLNFKNDFLNIIKTFILVTFAWIFFKANTFKDAIYVIINIFNINFSNIGKQILSIGWDKFDLILIFISIISIFIIELLKYKKQIYSKIKKISFVYKLIIYLVLTLIILIFGYYGPGFDKTDFIYLGY